MHNSNCWVIAFIYEAPYSLHTKTVLCLKDKHLIPRQNDVCWLFIPWFPSLYLLNQGVSTCGNLAPKILDMMNGQSEYNALYCDILNQMEKFLILLQGIISKIPSGVSNLMSYIVFNLLCCSRDPTTSGLSCMRMGCSIQNYYTLAGKFWKTVSQRGCEFTDAPIFYNFNIWFIICKTQCGSWGTMTCPLSPHPMSLHKLLTLTVNSSPSRQTPSSLAFSCVFKTHCRS